MISNSGEDAAVFSNRQREMAVYDALPPVLRLAFQEASRNFTVIPAGRAIVSGVTPARVLAVVVGEDTQVRARTALNQRLGRPW